MCLIFWVKVCFFGLILRFVIILLVFDAQINKVGNYNIIITERANGRAPILVFL